jgi:malonyl-CoA O-methyltransferase
MGRERWRHALEALDATRAGPAGRVTATFEVIYGHAWKAAPTRTPEGHAIVKLERRR